MKKNVLIIAFKDFNKNLRGIKQIQLLKDEFKVDYVGYEDYKSESNNFYKIIPKFRVFNIAQKAMAFIYLLFGMHKNAFKMMYDCSVVYKLLNSKKYDLIISHDLKPLEIIFGEKINLNNAKIFLDAHEYFKGVGAGFLNTLIFKRYNLYSYKKINEVKHINTVNKSISDLYAKEFPSIENSFTLNVPIYKNIKPKKVENQKIKMIHHGYADPDRKLELMIETMRHLDNRFHLDLMLVSLTFEDVYINKLIELSKTLPNVRIIPPVKPIEVVDFLSNYDIGIFILPETTISLKYALPNKFFDFIQARLMVTIGPSFEMAKIVNKYNLGIVSASFEPQKIAQELNKLTTTQIMEFKNNANIAALELNAEKQLKELNNTILNLLSETIK